MERETLEMLRMEMDNYERAITERGYQEGLIEGLEEARKELHALGEAEGRVSGFRTAIETLLDAHGLELSADGAERLRTCDDEPTLISWVRRAAIGADLFTEH